MAERKAMSCRDDFASRMLKVLLERQLSSVQRQIEALDLGTQETLAP